MLLLDTGDEVIEKIMSARLRRRLAKVAAGEGKAGPQYRIMKTTGTGTDGLVTLEDVGVNTDDVADDVAERIAQAAGYGLQWTLSR